MYCLTFVGGIGGRQEESDATLHYDTSGRLWIVTGPGLPDHGVQYGYLANSRRVETVSYKTDTTTVATSTYSPLSNRDLVESVENKAGSTTISKYEYGYNAIGQRTHVVNTGSTFSASAHNQYDYNDRREVIESKRFAGTDPQTPGSEATGQRRDYAYDPIGNRTSHADGGGSAVSYTANLLNQYTGIGSETLAFDVDGNLLDDGLRQYTWDAENRLVAVETSETTLTFTYDYRGRRVRAVFGDDIESKEQRYIWDDWTQRGSAKMDSAEPEPEGRSEAGCLLGGEQVNLLLVLNWEGEVVRRFTWGLDIAEQAAGLPMEGRPGAAAGGAGGLLAAQEVLPVNGKQDFLYFYDGNGNVGQVLDWDGLAIAAHYEYDAFGRTIASSGGYAEVNRFRFSTKYQDYETDLYYYGYRYYSPTMGRWLNRDPINEVGAMIQRGTQKLQWEEETNLYTMLRNDAVNQWDFLGLCTHGDIRSRHVPVPCIYMDGWCPKLGFMPCTLHQFCLWGLWVPTGLDCWGPCGP